MALVVIPKCAQYQQQKKPTIFFFIILYINLTSGHLYIRGFWNFELFFFFTTRYQFLSHRFIINHLQKTTGTKKKVPNILWFSKIGIVFHLEKSTIAWPRIRIIGPAMEYWNAIFRRFDFHGGHYFNDSWIVIGSCILLAHQPFFYSICSVMLMMIQCWNRSEK